MIGVIKKQAVELRDTINMATPMAHLDAVKIDLDLTMSRPLFRVSQTPNLEAETLELGESDIDLSLLHEQHHVDKLILRDHIQNSLQGKSQVTLKEICEDFPPEQGVAEIMTYLHMACDDEHTSHSAMVDTSKQESIILVETGQLLKVPQVIFTQILESKEVSI